MHLPQPLLFKVYLFNVTNSKEVLKGAIPIVNEVGPYIYRQFRDKIVSNISPDESIVSFKTIQRFVFDIEASAPYTESDDVVLLNPHLNVSESSSHFLHSIANCCFPANEPTVVRSPNSRTFIQYCRR